MGILERRQRQKEEVRAAILEAAWRLVTEEGWQSLSIRKIADAIEYSVPVVYDHFQNKDAILLEFTKGGFRLLTSKLAEAKAAHTEPSNQLTAMAQAYWDFAFNNKEYYQLMYGVGMPTCETVRRVPELAAFVKLTQTTIHELILNSKHPETDPVLKFHTFWSMLHGLISINMMGDANTRDGLNQMVLKDIISSFIKGIIDN